jgi:hypothetical protein
VSAELGRRGLAAEFGVYGPERTWLIEGHGVDPDIVVDNLPHAAFKDKDAQLEVTIKYLQSKSRRSRSRSRRRRKGRI